MARSRAPEPGRTAEGWQPPTGAVMDAVAALDRVLDRDWSKRDRKRLVAAMVVVEDAPYAEMLAAAENADRTDKPGATPDGGMTS